MNRITNTITPFTTVIRLLGVVQNPANGFPARPLAHRYALQANEHRTVGFKTDLHLWALARIGGYLVAGDA